MVQAVQMGNCEPVFRGIVGFEVKTIERGINLPISRVVPILEGV